MMSIDNHSVVLFDFEYVGIWNPTIDLFSYVVNCPENHRTEYEKILLESYHARLIQYKRVPASYTYERMYKDYITVGVG